jgi:hypothetical protein
MSFDVSKHLGSATLRAKSDVANKLVGMFLHEVSRRLVAKAGMGVKDPLYVKSVGEAFASGCLYCGKSLEQDRAAVEHLDGMNRFRAGLHVPGNVAVACVRCNREKRRDDQVPTLVLAATGWESFLSHDGTRCPASCKTCAYWRGSWPDDSERADALCRTRERILDFRKRHSEVLGWNERLRPGLIGHLDRIYRECQVFATECIVKNTAETLAELDLIARADHRGSPDA